MSEAKTSSEACVPSGWCDATLDDLTTRIANGFTCKQSKEPIGTAVSRIETISKATVDLSRIGYVEGLSSADISKWNLQFGDVLFSHINSDEHLGKTALFEMRGVTLLHGMNLIVMRPATSATSGRLLNYWLTHCRFSGLFRSIAQHAVNQSSINITKLREIRLPLPPQPEQARITDALDELFSDLDAGVAALERARQNLKLYRAAVLKAAVEGTLTTEWRKQHPDIVPASVLLEHILAERRRHWEGEQLRKFKEKGQAPPRNWKAKYKEPVAPDTTELAGLPEGWVWASVEQLSVLVTDGDHNPPKRIKGGVAHLTAKNVKNMRFDIDGCTFISSEGAQRVFRRYRPISGDLIITCVGTVGRTALVAPSFEFSPDRNLAAIRCTAVGPSNKYFQMFLEAPQTQVTMASASGSTAQPHLYLGDLRCLAVALPPMFEQDTIVEAVEDQLSIIEHIEIDIDAKLKSAQVLRQAILRHAFIGKLVPQDPNDESASELLKRIAAEREAHARESATKRANRNNHGPRIARRRTPKRNQTKDA